MRDIALRYPFLNKDMSIKEWLDNSGSFVDGFNLYKQTNYSPKILKRLESVLKMNYVPADKMALLREELQLQECTTAPPIVKAPTIQTSPSFSKDENQQRVELHKIHSRLYADMCSATTNEERFLYAKKIMEEIIPVLDDIYLRNSSSESLNLTVPVDPIRDTVNKMMELQNLKKRVSRLKGYINKESTADHKKIAYEIELIEILERIEKLTTYLGL